MKLYECTSGDKVRIISDTKVPPVHRDLYPDEILTFYHIDGMYSYCKDNNGNTVHPCAWLEVEMVDKPIDK